MTEFIADSKFMALRAELQEQSMLLREILKVLQSSGAPAEQAVASAKPKEAKAPAPKTPAIPKEAVGKATVETVETVDTGKTEQWGNAPKGYDAVDTDKPAPWGTPQDASDKTDAPKDKTEPVQMATRLPSAAEESNPQPPAVPKRGQTETGSRGR